MDELTLLQDACEWEGERCIIDAGCIDKLADMELVFYYDGVYWLSCEGEAYARGEMC